MERAITRDDQSTPASTGKPASTTTVKPQPASIHGTVEYREGDGPNITIRPGAVAVQITAQDATLSWADGETRGSAAIPINIFRDYVAQGAIRLHGGGDRP